MATLWDMFFGGGGSDPEVRHLRLTLEPLDDGEIVQGHLARLKLTVKALKGPAVRVRHLQFNLLNKREERRSLLERLVTHSRFVFRFNLERDLDVGSEFTQTIEFLPPICREGTRKTRFVTISWEIEPRLICGEVGSSNSGTSWRHVGTKFEIEIQGRR